MNSLYRLLIAAILLLAMNLRGPLLCVTPLLQFIRVDYGFSNSVAGLLLALPLLVFALASAFMADLSQKVGVGRLIVFSIILMIIGELTRYFGGLAGLFVGTIILSLGITVGNVLIPALIRGFFPDKMGIMTSSYSSIMQVTTTLALFSAVPISYAIGWTNALLLLVVLTSLALICWIPFYGLTFDSVYTGYKGLPAVEIRTAASNAVSKVSVKKLMKNSLAWDVSLFMGIQSLTFYCCSTWIPTIVTSKGISPEWGGYTGSVYQFCSLGVTFIVPLLLQYFKDQKGIALLSCLVYAIGIIGLFMSSNQYVILIMTGIAGMAAGSTFALALMFFVLRTESAMVAATLSGLGQAIGYILASLGPTFIGYLYDLDGSWYSAMVAMLIFDAAFAFVGYRAGRDVKITGL